MVFGVCDFCFNGSSAVWEMEQVEKTRESTKRGMAHALSALNDGQHDKQNMFPGYPISHSVTLHARLPNGFAPKGVQGTRVPVALHSGGADGLWPKHRGQVRPS